MDDLDTFEGWLKHQGYDVRKHPDRVAQWQTDFEVAHARREAARSAAYFTQPCSHGEFRCAITIEDGGVLRSVLVVTRSKKKGEFFVLYPSDGSWNPHASYHRCGQYHFKGDDQIVTVSQRQRLDQPFKGAEHLGSFGGHDTAAPTYNPANFSSVIEIPRAIVNGMRCRVLVDLVEPGTLPAPQHRAGLVCEKTYRDFPSGPWLVVAVAA